MPLGAVGDTDATAAVDGALLGRCAPEALDTDWSSPGLGHRAAVVRHFVRRDHGDA